MPLSSSYTDVHPEVSTENQRLKQQISQLEFEVVSLKADYASAIDDCADVHKLKLKLETELQSTYTIKEENSDTDRELEKVKLKFEIIEN